MSAPPSVRIALETVTPLFLAGAEERGTPELRPPAVRGALRAWLRAVLAGALGDRDSRRLSAEESRVFGSAGDSESGGSAIVVRVLPVGAVRSEAFAKEAVQFVTKGGRNLQQPSGRDYLYWSMASTRNDPGKQFAVPGTRFDLVVAPRPGAAGVSGAVENAVSALWLLVHLGGLGSRARRTGGSVSPVTPSDVDGLRFGLQANSLNGMGEELATGLRTIRARVQGLGAWAPTGQPAIDALHPDSCRVWVLGLWPNPKAAVEEVGAAMRDFRTYREPDHSNVARWMTRGESPPTVERAVFGLPIPYRYSGNGPVGTIQPFGQRERLDRRASPLWLSVSKTAGGQAVVTATLFTSRFLPSGVNLTARGGGSAARPVPPPANYDLILRWIRDEFPNAVEVKYG